MLMILCSTDFIALVYWWHGHDLVSASRDTDFVAARLRVFFCMISFMFFLVLRVESVSLFVKSFFLVFLFSSCFFYGFRHGKTDIPSRSPHGSRLIGCVLLWFPTRRDSKTLNRIQYSSVRNNLDPSSRADLHLIL